jgi:ATP-dependent RNA helicase DDX24/MAK5
VIAFTEGESERITYAISYLQGLPAGSKTIVFSNTIKSCRRVQFFIEAFGMEAVSLHSHMQQKQRLKKLEKFKKSKICNILIATDVAARGLDFNITHVLQMGVPVNGDTYVHRAGRTARANRTGEALILVDKKEASRWSEINDTITETTPNRQV